jgi:serine/threonine protein phosphatase PrpC
LTVLRSGSASDVGRIRTVNQDLPLERPNLYAVADGMGGHVGGEVAARVAVETLDQAFERSPTVDGLREAFSEANAAVWHESQANTDLRGMGTTLTAVALVGDAEGRDVLALANVGDSRAYVFSGGEMTQVTDDHSLAEERMRQGEMTEEEAAVHPQRHILTRALGVSSQVDADMWELELRTGDRLLLCSDGLTNELGNEEMADILGEVDDPAEAAQRLVDAANGHGGADNITVVVVDVQVGEEGEGAASKVTPLGLGAAALAAPLVTTAAVPVVGKDADDGGPDAPAGAGSGPSAVLSDATEMMPAVGQDETLAPGSRLAFGGQPATLAETGPSSDEFFMGTTAAVPVARSTARVPPPPGNRGSDKPEGKESRGARRRRLGIPRRITPRVIGFIILVAAVPVAAYYVLKWYAYDNWIVTSQGEQIVVKQGQPGGVLWFHPKVVDHTGYTTQDVSLSAIGPLKAGVERSSLHDAKVYVTSITTTSTTTTSTFPTTTTTLPARRIVTPLPAPVTTPTTAPVTTTTAVPVTTTTAAP